MMCFHLPSQIFPGHKDLLTQGIGQKPAEAAVFQDPRELSRRVCICLCVALTEILVSRALRLKEICPVPAVIHRDQAWGRFAL